MAPRARPYKGSRTRAPRCPSRPGRRRPASHRLCSHRRRAKRAAAQNRAGELAIPPALTASVGRIHPSPASMSISPCSSRPPPSVPHLTRVHYCPHRRHHGCQELQQLTGRLAASVSKWGTLMPPGALRYQAEGPPLVLDISTSPERRLCMGDKLPVVRRCSPPGNDFSHHHLYMPMVSTPGSPSRPPPSLAPLN
jgi:hypothetical protein